MFKVTNIQTDLLCMVSSIMTTTCQNPCIAPCTLSLQIQLDFETLKIPHSFWWLDEIGPKEKNPVKSVKRTVAMQRFKLLTIWDFNSSAVQAFKEKIMFDCYTNFSHRKGWDHKHHESVFANYAKCIAIV